MIWASINKEVRTVWVENLWYQHTLQVTGHGLLPRKVRMKIQHRLVIKAKNNVLWLYSDLRLLKASEFTCMSPDPTNAIKLQSLLTCREPSRNNDDETPSTKFARLLPRFWNGNERYLLSKLITNWSVKYFTHWKSYYPVPELAMDLSAIAKLNPISVLPVDKRNITKMREWASEHEQCVRQLTVRQQTTKFSAGTLPMSQPMGYKHTTRSSQQQCGRSHWKRGRGSHRRVWRKPETALEKSLAPRVSMTLTLLPIYLRLNYVRMRIWRVMLWWVQPWKLEMADK